jgi:hypothetical protein
MADEFCLGLRLIVEEGDTSAVTPGGSSGGLPDHPIVYDIVTSIGLFDRDPTKTCIVPSPPLSSVSCGEPSLNPYLKPDAEVRFTETQNPDRGTMHKHEKDELARNDRIVTGAAATAKTMMAMRARAALVFKTYHPHRATRVEMRGRWGSS